jgi:hypothetical protein
MMDEAKKANGFDELREFANASSGLRYGLLGKEECQWYKAYVGRLWAEMSFTNRKFFADMAKIPEMADEIYLKTEGYHWIKIYEFGVTLRGVIKHFEETFGMD